MNLKNGFIHLGIIAVFVVGLAVFASVKIFADSAAPQRVLENVNQARCQIRANTPACMDSDNDGWSDATERYLITDPNAACPGDANHSAWPPDINNDRQITEADGDLFKNENLFNSKAGDPNFNRRFDLNQDHRINLSDVLKFNRYLEQTCTAPESNPTTTPNPTPDTDQPTTPPITNDIFTTQ